ncbi:hypothetical protein BCR34DRAFT_576877 [Clohesyomyces aquaticus]|uniref:Uncharacterized protein n=1 Tax=Clohesyomyces aquaticus TaxID=1231657 RepID=A0A1Y1YLI8_9PLEO|nr:hypothetical protein BCR34DRAFT_576877 [Clohesyomyces aquaticus]
MLFPTASLALLLGSLSHLTSALPLDTTLTATAELSHHNIYLATCTPRDSSVGTSGAKFSAGAYFKYPINATEYIGDTKDPRSDHGVLVSDPASAWEGIRYRAKAWGEKTFSSDIPAGADSLEKGQIAGTVSLAREGYTENFICFRDGKTGVRVKEDDGIRGNCVADYWCPSISEKRKKDDDDS